MTDPGIISSIWHPTTAFAGLGGGIVGAWADGKASLRVWATYAAAGLITGNFLGEDAANITHLSELGAGFLIGGCAFTIILLFKGLVEKYQPTGGIGK